MAWAALMGFSSTYLLGVGLTSGQIGIIIALCGLVSAVLQPVLAGIIDRAGGNSLKKYTIGLLCFCIFLSVGMIFIPGHSTWIKGILFGLSIAILQTLSPLMNALAAKNRKTNFGVARGVGSVAYAVIFPLLGLLVAQWNVNAVPTAVIVTFACMGIAVLAYSIDAETDVQSEQKATDTRMQNFYKRYPRFLIMLIGVWLLYISHVLLMNFGYQIILTKGGDSVSWGTTGSIAAIMELPTMFLFAWFLKAKPSSFWVRISGISFFLQAIGALIIPNVFGYYCNQIFQLLGWAVIQVASVYYIREVISPEDAVKGQSSFTTVYTMATVIASAIGGMLIDYWGVSAMIFAAILTSGAGTAILLITVQKTEQ